MSEMKKTRRSSIVYICGDDTGGTVEPVSSLLGRKLHSIAGGDASLIALADDGIYTAPEGTLLSCLDFNSAVVGASVVVGVTRSGSLYSWGVGEMGELGLGPSHTSVDEPKYINYSTTFSAVSAGGTHCAAIDEKGNAYVWGQNFERQLGLYTKPLDEMQKLRSNACIEDLLFTPRCLPLSLSHPVNKITCGHAFTILVAKDGSLFSWGAGECGQLGTGRCTLRELPARVPTPPDSIIIDAACGSAHTLALSSSGQIFSWGMNKRGQLGLGDTATRHQPTLLPSDVVGSSSTIQCSRLFAHGHSSAAIDAKGQLFTWGSTSSSRLMQSVGGGASCPAPAHVTAFEHMVVDTFTFSGRASACLVYTHINSLAPILGPCKGAATLSMAGYGLWDSDKIVVKFAHKEGLGQARSCPGRFDVTQGKIFCRPPKLVDPGLYDVLVAMDGVTFQPEVHSYYAHREISSIVVAPRLIDLRVPRGSLVTTSIRGLVTYVDTTGTGQMQCWPRESDLTIFVKLFVSCSPPGSSSAFMSEVIVPASLVPLPVVEGSEVLDGQSQELGAAESQTSLESLDLATLEGGGLGVPQPITVDREVTCEVDFSSLGPPGSLLVIRTAVGLNGQDFGPATPELAPIICHSFQPSGVSPCCCPVEYSNLCDAESSARTITVYGSSFIPTAKLPPGSSIEAVITAELPKKGGKATKYERIVPVCCQAADYLTLVMPTALEMADPSILMASMDLLSSGSNSRPASPEKPQTGGGSRPSSQAGSVKAPPTPVEMLCTIMFKLVSPRTPSNLPPAKSPAKGGKSPSKSSATKKPAEEPVQYLSPEAVTVYLYNPQGCTVDPVLTRRSGGGTLVLQGATKGGFTFSSSDVRVVFSRPDLGLEIVVGAAETWMLGLGEAIPVPTIAGAASQDYEDEDGENEAADLGEVSAVASLHEGSIESLGAGSLGELSSKHALSVSMCKLFLTRSSSSFSQISRQCGRKYWHASQSSSAMPALLLPSDMASCEFWHPRRISGNR